MEVAGGFGRLRSRELSVSIAMSATLQSVSLVLLLVVVGPLPGASGSPIMAPETHRLAPGLDDGRGGVVDPSLLEQNSEVDMQKLLDNLKGQFLRTFNLSGLGPRHSASHQQQAGGERMEPPEYMMELYNRFANDRTAMPTANIIRSFKDEDSSPCSVGARGVRIHPLLFNVSLPHHERVTAAELRLYTLVQTDRHLYAGVDRKVTVYEVEQRYHGNSSGADAGADAGGVTRGDALDAEPEAGPEEERMGLVELASRQVYGMDNGWESFDMTAAVHRWRKSSHSTTHRLEVHIASLDAGVDKNSNGEKVAEEEEEEEEKEEEDGTVEIDTEGDNDSKDGGRHVTSSDGSMDIETGQEDRHRPLMIIFSDDTSGDHHRAAERRELNEMLGHEAVGAGGLGDNLNGLLDELDQMGLGDDGGDGGESETDEETLMQMHSNLIFDSSSRIRRNAKGNHCKKNSLYVEFKDIGWDSWILAPTGYEAFECTGVCSFPLTPHVKPTKHAMVQTLVNMKSPQKVAPACCVPTKLDPISLLYLDDAGVVTYKYKFEGMVVAECGCR